MRVALAVISVLLLAGEVRAADPVYLDELVETPLATLQRQFEGLKNEGCYRLASDRFLLVSMDKKDQKPWRVIITSIAPCRRPTNGPTLDVRSRSGLNLGETTVAVIQRMGRPDASAPSDAPLRRLGETEFFYICRITEGCARHTSVYFQKGVVTAISEWYSE
jgi:hypothetical protein